MLDFLPVDLNAPLDLKAQLAYCTDQHKVKGLFLQGPLDVVRRAGLQPPEKRRYIAFKDYPCAEYVELTAECARIAFPRSPLRDAIRRVGWEAYPRFAGSMVGKVILAAFASNAEDTFKAAERAYSVLLTRGTVRADVQPGRAMMELRDITTFADSFHVGVMESILEAFEQSGSVKIRKHSIVDVDLLVEW